MILLVGASGVLGSEIYSELVNRNERVVGVGRTKPKIFLDKDPFFRLDLNNGLDTQSFFEDLMSEYCITGVVYNSAYTITSKSLLDIKEEDIDKMLKVNVLGYTSLMAAIEKSKVDANRRRLVYVSSNSLQTLNASNPFYIASKASGETITKVFAKKYGNLVTANVVRPGLMLSKLTEERFADSMEEIEKLTPLGRLITPQEVAEIVCYLLCDSPPALTGQLIAVDGGRSL